MNYQKELDKLLDDRWTGKREPGAKSAAAQLLRSMQQLCVRVSEQLF